MEDFAKTFPRTLAVVESHSARVLHTGIQLYISRDFQTLADTAIGISRPGVSMTPDNILLWLSASKPIAAVALSQLWEKGLLDLDDRVVKFLPEFAAKGKEIITLRHLLTHMAGIRWANYLPTMPWTEVIERICAVGIEPKWIMGQSAGYHALTTWFILGEIIRRLDPKSRSYDHYVREEIFLPLDMNDSWFSLTPEKYAEYGNRIALLANTGPDQPRQMQLDIPEQAALCVPGAGGRGPARELCRFYEMLLRRGKNAHGRQIISPQSVEAITAKHRVGLFDLTFKHVVDWGLGFICNSAQYGDDKVPYGFGPHASRRAFGHGGSQSSIGMADPEHGLAIVVVFNGRAGEIAHHERMRETLGAIYEDLGLER